MRQVTHTEKLVFGADVRLHVVTQRPLESGIGAASESAQAHAHIRMIAETDPDAAAVMLEKLRHFEQTGELPAAPAVTTPPKRSRRTW
jgi:hypothetical protein